MRRLFIGLAILSLATGACGSKAAGDAAAGKQESASPEKSDERNAVRASAELQKKWGIDVAQPTRAQASAAIVIPGLLALDPTHTAQITSLLDGKVLFVGAQVGDEVKRNQVLVTLHAPAFSQAKTAYLEAGSKLELARREL